MSISLRPGTVVQLKSGGPKMTVVGENMVMEVATGQVYCEWFDNKNNPMTGAFSETSLKVVD